MKVLFIGQNPSKSNMDENVAFVGSRSYATMLKWINDLKLDRREITFINASKKLGKVTMKDAELRDVFLNMCRHKAVICLGRYSEKCVRKIRDNLEFKGLDYHYLPHPSGLNRTLNDRLKVNKMLGDARNYLKQKGVYDETQD